MIQIELVDYDNITDLGLRITKYVNGNLRDIVRVLKDFLEEDSDFGMDGFFPRDFLIREPKECRNAVDELYEIICSTNIRDFIKPKYEYLLYSILCWWDDCADTEEDLLINPVDEKLKNDLASSDRQNTLRTIQNFEEYYYICFPDHDFLSEQLNSMVVLYLRNPKIVEMFFQYEDLDDFINLMECDLRERYLEARKKKYRSQEKVEEGIIEEMVSVLKRFQKRIVNFESRDEVEITADIQDAISGILNNKYNLHISREFTMGRAIKKLGETDLYIYKETNGLLEDYAVLENKYIENFTEQYNQLMGYLNPNFKFGITLSINRNMSVYEGFEEIVTRLKAIKGSFQPIQIDRIGDNNVLMLVSQHIIPENNQKMNVYHLIFQLNDRERKEIAIRAREKRKCVGKK